MKDFRKAQLKSVIGEGKNAFKSILDLETSPNQITLEHNFTDMDEKPTKDNETKRLDIRFDVANSLLHINDICIDPAELTLISALIAKAKDQILNR